MIIFAMIELPFEKSCRKGTGHAIQHDSGGKLFLLRDVRPAAAAAAARRRREIFLS